MTKELKKGPSNIREVVIENPRDGRYGAFLNQAELYLEERLKELNYISPKGSHGRHRSKREIDDIRRVRAPEKGKIEAALEVLAGDNPRMVKFFISEEGKQERILGFQVLDPRLN